MENENKINEKYENIIEEISFDSFVQKVKNGEIPYINDSSKTHVISYSGIDYDKQADNLLNLFVEQEICNMIEIDPKNMYEKIYSMETTNKFKVIVAILKETKIDIDLYNQLFNDVKEEFTVKNFLNEENVLIEKNKEKEQIDPLHFKETQESIDYVTDNIKTLSITEIVSKIKIKEEIENIELMEQLYLELKEQYESSEDENKQILMDNIDSSLSQNDQYVLLKIFNLYLSLI